MTLFLLFTNEVKLNLCIHHMDSFKVLSPFKHLRNCYIKLRKGTILFMEVTLNVSRNYDWTIRANRSVLFLFVSSYYPRDYLFNIAEAGIIALELYPGFALYRGLYEFSQYSFTGSYMGTDGMRWKDLSDSKNGMTDAFIIIAVEWLVVLVVAFYADQVVSSGRSPLSFLQRHQKNLSSSFRKPSLQRQGSKVFVRMEKLDVEKEVNR